MLAFLITVLLGGFTFWFSRHLADWAWSWLSQKRRITIFRRSSRCNRTDDTGLDPA